MTFLTNFMYGIGQNQSPDSALISRLPQEYGYTPLKHLKYAELRDMRDNYQKS